MAKIDLEYLTNPCYTVKIPEKKKDKIYCVNFEDLNFYKKRIFELTRKMLLGGSVNTKINDAFHGWAKVSIEHFKFIDKMQHKEAEDNLTAMINLAINKY